MNTETVNIIVHTGIASVENGAQGPVRVYFDLAKALLVHPQTGSHYGDDRLQIPKSDWPTAKEMLEEANMLYRMDTTPPGPWLNVQTEIARERLTR